MSPLNAPHCAGLSVSHSWMRCSRSRKRKNSHTTALGGHRLPAECLIQSRGRLPGFERARKEDTTHSECCSQLAPRAKSSRSPGRPALLSPETERSNNRPSQRALIQAQMQHPLRSHFSLFPSQVEDLFSRLKKGNTVLSQRLFEDCLLSLSAVLFRENCGAQG